MPIFIAQPFTNEVDPAASVHASFWKRCFDATDGKCNWKDKFWNLYWRAISYNCFQKLISPEHLSTKILGDFAYVVKTSGYVAETYWNMLKPWHWSRWNLVCMFALVIAQKLQVCSPGHQTSRKLKLPQVPKAWLTAARLRNHKPLKKKRQFSLLARIHQLFRLGMVIPLLLGILTH